MDNNNDSNIIIIIIIIISIVIISPPWRTRYGKFSKSQICFCGLDPGNLKFETVRTHKQHTCFKDLRRSIWKFAI